VRGNSFGRFLVLTTFGESHGPALGAVIDGCPAGIHIAHQDFAAALRRRRPGQSSMTSSRKEDDEPEILSGIFENVTLGTPIAVIVRNMDARSEDYDPKTMRPGHADVVWEEKYRIRDHRGGGRASGRETLARVIGAVVAEKILPASVHIVAFTRRIGTLEARYVPENLTRALVDEHATRCPDSEVAERMSEELLRCKADGDSRGGIVELWIDGVPAGWGEPVFRKMKSDLAAALMSVGAVIGVALGDSCNEVVLPGSVFHAINPESSNQSPRSYGIQGGITNGDRITLRAFIKPVSTIGALARQGRHDPCIVPRVVPVLEAMVALVVADFSLQQRLDRISGHE